ncbi:MAG: acetate kinase [Bifidobacteriaceae bacterium]|jgi:acetate kinase|nr:acetate kinase [Bifidobacteriaceae bacterium]
MAKTVFVINAGSTSIKYQLIDVDAGQRLASGLVERIGQDVSTVAHSNGDTEFEVTARIADHTRGMEHVMEMFRSHGPDLAKSGLVAVGHRVVQGGDIYAAPALATPEVKATIAELSVLAPLHNPPNLAGIEAAQHALPDLPHVAVFDTAFHRTMPPAAYTYAIPRDLAAAHKIRRYGMHGTSHRYVSRKTAELMGKRPQDVNVIVIHIGGGGSVCAVQAGKSIETSMGLTPLQGLVMATRCGDIDPAILFYLHRQAGMGFDELDAMCNKASGLLGLGGSPDMRDIRRMAAEGDQDAQIALATFSHRVKSYIGAYYAHLGRVDAIAFTAGIGENDDATRAECCAGLESFGIAIDPAANNGLRGGVSKRISPEDSPVQVWVVATNEELEIAREAWELVEEGECNGAAGGCTCSAG